MYRISLQVGRLKRENVQNRSMLRRTIARLKIRLFLRVVHNRQIKMTMARQVQP